MINRRTTIGAAALVAFIGVYYVGVSALVGPGNYEDFEAAEEEIVSIPGEDTPWYEVGAMPLALLSPVAVAAVLVWDAASAAITRVREWLVEVADG